MGASIVFTNRLFTIFISLRELGIIGAGVMTTIYKHYWMPFVETSFFLRVSRSWIRVSVKVLFHKASYANRDPLFFKGTEGPWFKNAEFLYLPTQTSNSLVSSSFRLPGAGCKSRVLFMTYPQRGCMTGLDPNGFRTHMERDYWQAVYKRKEETLALNRHRG